MPCSGLYCGRYAPSPTGPLHLGNLRTALLAWLHARLNHGRFIIRMDDLDVARNKPNAANQILEDLDWMGLDYDGEVIYQSNRSEGYTLAFEALSKAGRIFPCVCTRKDIADALSAPDMNKPTARYPGTCRPDRNRPADPDHLQTAWRFMVVDEEMTFYDQLLGRQHENLARNPGDFVVRRKDKIFAYQLASAVDDALLGVTDVVRGADLLDSTARQIALFRALNCPVPRFWHLPVMNDGAGVKLSKRDCAGSLAALREAGRTAQSVVGELAESSGLLPEKEHLSARELLRHLSPESFTLLLKRPR